VSLARLCVLACLVLGASCGETTGPASAAAPADGIPTPALGDVDPDVVAAVRAARVEVEKDPASGDAWGRYGNRLFVHDFLREAAACFAKAEELDPARYVWTYRRGLCLIDDDPAAAAQHLERALRSLEEHAPAHETYALVLFRLGREDEALAHYQRASELDARAAQPETGLGQIYLARGELDEARAHLEEAVRRNPRSGEAHAALAQVYFGLGREKEAQEQTELSRTLPQASRREDVFASPTLPPAGAPARTKYGRQLERQHKLDEAAEQYRLALQSNPDYYTARWSLAQLLAKRGELEEARELLREAQRRNPAFEQVTKDLQRLGTLVGGEAESSDE